MAERLDHENEKTARAERLVYLAPETAGIESAALSSLGEDDVLVEALYSGISRGTESLVFGGKVPEGEWERMRCPHQSGDFSFPLSYGYALSGKVAATGSGVRTLSPGDRVFVLHPHQNRMIVRAGMANRIPDGVPSRRAVLAANMETALNAVWDSGLEMGDKATVIGAGVVGLLTAYLARKTAERDVAIVDIDERKRRAAEALGLSFALPGQAPADNRIVFHTSASAAGLQAALALATFEGRIVEMSWYGEREVSLRLGGAFHSQRLQIVSSQVGHVSPARRAATSYAERMAEALRLLKDPALDALLEDAIFFKALPGQLARILGPGSATLCQVVDYDTPTGD